MSDSRLCSVDEYMDIYSPRGTCVFYAHRTAGYPQDQEDARKFLEFGKCYRVWKTEVHSSETRVWLFGVENPPYGFNSVTFSHAVTPAMLEELASK